MLNIKDRSQVLRMAGNIASGFATHERLLTEQYISEMSVKIAFSILKHVDEIYSKDGQQINT